MTRIFAELMTTMAATVAMKIRQETSRLFSRKSRKPEAVGDGLPRAPRPPTRSRSWLRTDILAGIGRLGAGLVALVGLDDLLDQGVAHDVGPRERVKDDPRHVPEDVADLEQAG